MSKEGLVKRQGIAVQFEHSFLPKKEGREKFFKFATNPELNAAINAMFPHGMGCSKCMAERMKNCNICNKKEE